MCYWYNNEHWCIAAKFIGIPCKPLWYTSAYCHSKTLPQGRSLTEHKHVGVLFLLAFNHLLLNKRLKALLLSYTGCGYDVFWLWLAGFCLVCRYYKNAHRDVMQWSTLYQASNYIHLTVLFLQLLGNSHCRSGNFIADDVVLLASSNCWTYRQFVFKREVARILPVSSCPTSGWKQFTDPSATGFMLLN